VVPLSNEITVVANPADHNVIVAADVVYAQVSAPGPQGPAGAPGPIGPAGGDLFVYDRNGVPAQQWPIAHNLGRFVHITVLLDSGEEITPDVTQSDLNNAVIAFGVPTSGKALVG
jgi:hypothetical protein